MVGWSSHCFQEGVCTLISVLTKPFPKGLVPFGLLHVPFGNMLKVSKIAISGTLSFKHFLREHAPRTLVHKAQV